MKPDQWNRRKVVLLEKISLVAEKYRSKPGRNPRDLSYWEELLQDEQVRRRMTVSDFVRVESKVNTFWLS